MPSGRAVTAVVVAATLAWPPGWLGSDKLKHFFLSAFVQGTLTSSARAAGAGRASSVTAGAAGAAVAGLLKEVRDRRAGRSFSASDLVWDAGGAAAMAALLRRAR